MPYVSGECGIFVESLPSVASATREVFYVLGNQIFYTLDNENWVEIGKKDIKFNEILNRPKYDGKEMTSSTDIPKVPKTALEISYDNSTSNLIATNVQTAIDELNTISDNKLNKLPTPNILYGNDQVGELKAYPFSNTKTPNSIAQRTAHGTLKSTNPIEQDDLTTKQYVDDLVQPMADDITNIQTNISSLNTRTTNLESRLTLDESRITNNETNISNLLNRVSKNETDITTINTNITNINNEIKDIQDDISDFNNETTQIKTDITDLETKLNKEISDREDQDIVSIEAGLGTNNNQVALVKKDGTRLTTHIPLATSTQNGLMTIASYDQIIKNRDEINSIKQQGGKYIGQSFATKADLDTFVIPSSIIRGDFTFVRDDEEHDDAITRYIFNGTKFEYAYTIENDPIGLATDTTPGLVLSSNSNGKIFVDTDGSMTLNGYSNLQTDISNKVDKVPGKGLSTNDYTNNDKSKVDMLEDSGDGSKYLANDGTYKEIKIPEVPLKDILVDGKSIVDKTTKTATLEPIATSGSWNHLKDIPVDLIHDINYVHTDNNFTNHYKDMVEILKNNGLGNSVLADNGQYIALHKIAVSGSWNDLKDIPSDLVQDSDYVHTDNNLTDDLYDKLSNLDSLLDECGKIKSVSLNGVPLDIDSNKNVDIPIDPNDLQLKSTFNADVQKFVDDTGVVQDVNYVHTDNNFTTASVNKLNGIEDGAQVNIIEIIKADGKALPINTTDKSVDLSGAGFTTSTDFEALEKKVNTNIKNIQSLQASGLWRGIFDTDSDVPTDYDDPNFIGGNVYLNDYIIVREDSTHKDDRGNPCKTRYYATAIDSTTKKITWTYYDKEEGNIAIATNDDVGVVKGVADVDDDNSSVKGMVSIANTDGEMKVNGWDKVIISPNKSVRRIVKLTQAELVKLQEEGKLEPGTEYLVWDDQGSGWYDESFTVEGIYFWDGLSSADNEDNIGLWQEILDKSLERPVLVIGDRQNDTAISRDCKGIFVLDKKDLVNGTHTFKGVVVNIDNDPLKETIDGKLETVGNTLKFKQPQVEIVIENLEVKSVTRLKDVSVFSQAYLPTNSTQITSYTPTHDYHPATKKYVDDLVDSQPDNGDGKTYYWDGRSNIDNPDNIDLWKEIIENSRTQAVLVYGNSQISDQPEYEAIFIVNNKKIPDSIFESTTETTITLLSYSKTTSSTVNGSYGIDPGIKEATVRLKVGNSTVSEVSTISTKTVSQGYSYLPTNSNSAVTNFTPTYDYHPSTKKYTDEKIEVSDTEPTHNHWDIWIDEDGTYEANEQDIAADLLDYYRTGEIDDKLKKYVKKAGDTMTGTLNSRAIIPSTDSTYDLGTSAKKYQSIYSKVLDSNVYIENKNDDDFQSLLDKGMDASYGLVLAQWGYLNPSDTDEFATLPVYGDSGYYKLKHSIRLDYNVKQGDACQIHELSIGSVPLSANQSTIKAQLDLGGYVIEGATRSTDFQAASYYTLPSVGGTLLTDKQVTFTQSATTGTKIGTLNVNGKNTILYAPPSGVTTKATTLTCELPTDLT